jgi:hypothetical protein
MIPAVSKALACALLLAALAAPAAAQDIRGMENCGAEKQIDRRTGCLQANVEFLQQEIVKLRRETQNQMTAAKAEAAALKAALTRLETEMAQMKAKAAEPAAKK